MALGAADEQAAGLHHLLAVLDHLLLHLREQLVPGRVPLVGVRLETALGELHLREVLLVSAELDVHASAGHVGGDRDRERATRLGDHLTLALRVLRLGVQDRVLDARLVELLCEQLGDLDRDRADEHGLAGGVALLDLVDDGGPLAVLGLVDQVVAVVPDHRLVRGDLDHLKVVDLHELRGLCQRRAGHAAQLVVAAEVVLVGDRGDGLRLLLDRHALLGLDGLVQALRPAPPLEDAAGELVDDLDLAVDHGVVDVALVELLRLQRLLEVVDQVAVLGAVEVVDAEELLGLRDALLGHRHRLVLLVGLEVEVGLPLLRLGLEPLGLLARLHDLRELRELVIEVGSLLGLAGDDQRRARLVDEDVVDLVDDAEAVAALGLLLDLDSQVVAQVVEAELRVGPVDDVAGVRLVLVHVLLARLKDADGHAEQVVDRLHPHGVAAGQVVVHRHEVDAPALHRLAVLVARGERVQDHGQRGGERLALAGPHLGDGAVVQDHAADQLDVEMALAQSRACRPRA